MRVFSFGGESASNCYLALDAHDCGVVIDPSVPPDVVFRQRPDVDVQALLLTHTHFDHMLYLDAWRRATHAPLCVTAADARGLSDPTVSLFSRFLGEETTFEGAERVLEDGDVIAVGEDELRVLLTPGHTAGSCTYLGRGVAFSGDTLFRGGVGRTDFPGGSASDLFRSLRALCALDDETVVYPGHGPDSTVGEEKRTNPYLTAF